MYSAVITRAQACPVGLSRIGANEAVEDTSRNLDGSMRCASSVLYATSKPGYL